MLLDNVMKGLFELLTKSYTIICANNVTLLYYEDSSY